MQADIYTGFAETALLVDRAVDFVQSKQHGASNLFIGRVRNFNLGKIVIGVSYDAYVPLALKVFNESCREAKIKFGEDLRCYIQHFKGRLNVGELSVVIAVSTRHREESFAACRYLIEALKHRAPIWKQEHYINGDSEWVQGHALCQQPH